MKPDLDAQKQYNESQLYFKSNKKRKRGIAYIMSQNSNTPQNTDNSNQEALREQDSIIANENNTAVANGENNETIEEGKTLVVYFSA